MIKIFLLLSLLLSGLSVNSQSGFDFQRLNTSHGLSNNTVIALLQDKKGFLWIGTDDGLNRYDGFDFKIFKTQPQVKNSINHNIAKTIFEDSKGNIWIGTDGGGVSKYNPTLETFTNYKFSETDNSSLSHNNVSAITEDKEGNIYIATYGGGINVLKPLENSFTYIKNGNLTGLSSNYINALLADDEANLWIGTWAKGVDKFNLKTGEFQNFQNIAGNVNSLGSNTVNCFFKDKNKNIWAGTWQGGLSRYDKSKKAFVQITLRVHGSQRQIKPVIRTISEDNHGNLWLGTFGDGLIRFNIAAQKIDIFKNEPGSASSLVNNNIWSSCFSKDNILWIGTIDGGLNKLDLNKRRFEQITKISSTYDPFKSTIVTSLFETTSGEILVGTRDDGFSIFDKELMNFSNFQSQGGSALINNTVSCLVQDRFGDYWIGTQDGLSLFSQKSKSFKNYAQSAYNLKTLSINNITNIFEDRSGNIWIATWGGGVNKYNREGDYFDHYQATEKSKVTFKIDMNGQKVSDKGVYLSGFTNGWSPSETKLYKLGNDIYGITLDLYPGRIEFKFVNGDKWGNEEKVPSECAENNNRVVIVGNRDISLDDAVFSKTCHATNYGPEKSVSETGNHISSNHVYCFAQDQNEFLWFGTNNGLSRFDNKENKFTNYVHKADSENSISDNHVSYILVSKTGNLWIGTLGGGINFFDTKDKKFTCYTELDGLSNNMVKSILEDNYGNIWIATNNGISKFNPSTREFLNFDTYNGLNESSFHIGSSLKRSNGQLLFGSTNGIVAFHPDSFETGRSAENVCFSDFRIFNKSVPVGKLSNGRTILEKSIPYADHVSLSYKDNIISFHFTNLHYATPEKNRFAYKLEGFDKDWHYTNARDRSATYTNLNGGTYTFLVKTLSNDGKWGINPTRLNVYVKPPFWKTLWFFISLMILITIGIYFWYRFRIIARERKLLNEKIKAEAKVTQLEKEKLQNEIEHKNNELASLTLHITNKVKLLNEQISHLELVAKQSDKPTREKLDRLIFKLQDEMNMDKDWEFFEKHFDKVHLNFISNLKNMFPQLSANEIRLAAYIRMGMSTKEIAEITNKTVRGIESSRYRLRQNLNLDTSDNLNDFLFKL